MEISSTPRCEMNDQQSQFHNPSPHSVSASPIIMAPFFAKKLKSCQAWQSVSEDHIYLSCLRNIFWWSISSLTPACPTQTSLSWLGSRFEEESDLLHPIILKNLCTTFHFPPWQSSYPGGMFEASPRSNRGCIEQSGSRSFPEIPGSPPEPLVILKSMFFFVRKIKVFSDYWLSSVHLKWWFQ